MDEPLVSVTVKPQSMFAAIEGRGGSRGDFYQSDELLDLLEEVSSMPGIRRVLAGQS